METIDRFTYDHAFLSNFWPSRLALEPSGVIVPTVEHGYQAAKTNNQQHKQLIYDAATPGAAKRIGKTVDLRPDWEAIKYRVMYYLVRRKFFESTDLAERLLKTEGAILIEGNSWNDRYWGVCNGVGDNNLGFILMSVREQLRYKQL